jgi:poly-beta-1,6-N-acetyl-D-glucosamine synthase
MHFWDRLRLSVYAPIAYFIFYLMDFVQFWAICKCLVRIRSLLSQKGNTSRWVSPRRIGREASIS